MKVLVIAFSVVLLLFASFTGTSAAENIEVRVVSGGRNIFKGSVNTSGCTITDSAGKSHEISEPKAICALDTASKTGGFSYTIRDTSVGLFLESINGIGGDWYYWVNKNFAPVGFEDMTLGSGDSMVLNNGSNSFPEEPAPAAPEQPKTEESKSVQPATPTEQATPKQETQTQQAAQAQVSQRVEAPKTPEPPKAAEAPKQVEQPRPATQPTPAPAQPAPARGTPSTPLVTQSTLPPSVASNPAPVQVSQLEVKTEPEQNKVVLAATTTEQKVVSPSPAKLPDSGPEQVFLLIGPTTFGIGNLLKKRTEHPLNRLLKPVKPTKKWYYS